MEFADAGQDDGDYMHNEVTEGVELRRVREHPVRTIDAADPAEVEELEAEWRQAYRKAQRETQRRRTAAWISSRRRTQ